MSFLSDIGGVLIVNEFPFQKKKKIRANFYVSSYPRSPKSITEYKHWGFQFNFYRCSLVIIGTSTVGIQKLR